MNEDCRKSSRNIMSIIGVEIPQNKNATSKLDTAAKNVEESSVAVTQETPAEFNKAVNNSTVSMP